MSPVAYGTPGGSSHSRHAGLSYGAVLLTDHDPSWSAVFEQLNANLAASLGALAMGIEHVGSTAVPGLKAKPIIDIAVGIRRAETEPVIAAIAAAGWIFRGDKGSDGGLLFVYEIRPQVRLAHTHAVEYGGQAWSDYLAFRDLLRADADARMRYGQLKQQLATQHPSDRAAYTAGKQELVRQLLGQ